MSQCGLLYARASQARPQHPAPGGGSARHSPVCPATAGGRVWSLHHEPVSPHSAHWVIAVSPPEGAGCFLGFPFGLRGAESAPASWGRVLPGGRQRVARAERRARQGLRVQPAGWVSAHFGPLLSEVALAVDFKEEVSWQKEKIEGVVQFPPINNPGGHGYLLVGGSACSPGGSSESSPSVGAVISEVPRPHMKGLTGHLHHHLGRGQSGPPSPGAHRRQRLGPFWEAGRQHGGIGALPWPGTWAVNSRGASFLMGVKRLHWEGAGPPGALWSCPPVSCCAHRESGTAQGLAKCQFQVGPCPIYGARRTKSRSQTRHWSQLCRALCDPHLGIFTLSRTESPKFPSSVDIQVARPAQEHVPPTVLREGRYDGDGK